MESVFVCSHETGVQGFEGMQETRQCEFDEFSAAVTYSKSEDISSDAERVGPASNGSLLGLNNNIINAWNPNAQKGVSSCDLTHQLNANWIFQMPFGRGRKIGTGSGRALDAAIGGWQLSGLFRLTSG
jgi:hypothetical protein